jgi:hypothetical protein
LFWQQERQANRIFWTGHRPRVPFPTPWDGVQHFGDRIILLRYLVRTACQFSSYNRYEPNLHPGIAS